MVDSFAYSFSYYSIPLLLVVGSLLMLGTFVLARERLTPVSALFFLITLVASIWLFCTAVVYSSANEQTALWWAKAAYLGVPFIAPAVYTFSTAVLRIQRDKLAIMAGVWLGSGLFAVAAIGTDWLVNGVRHYFWGYYTFFGWLGLPFIIFFSGLLVASMAHFWQHYRMTPPGRHKRRIRLLLFAFTIGYVGSVDFIACYGVPVYPFGYLPILGFVITAFAAIWTYRLADITPAFAAEEIVATMSDGLLVLDRHGIVRVVNGAACELFGYSREELLGRSVAETIGGGHASLTSPGLPGQLDTLVHLTGKESFEMPYTTPSGIDLTLSISASVMRDVNGEVEAVVCIARDITERKEMEEHLEQRVAERTTQLVAANAELKKEIAERRRAEEARSELLVLEQEARTEAEEAVRAREVLLSVVSHDLRNLMTVIKGSAMFLQKVVPADNVGRPSLHRMEIAYNRMNSLISDLLDFGRLQANQPLDLYKQRIDLVALARRVASIYEGDDRHQISVTSVLPSLVGLWDAPRIERVLENLVSNAIKYSPGGGCVEIMVEYEAKQGVKSGNSQSEGEGWALLTVRDEGIGIRESDLPFIFEWFRRAGDISESIRGTGIGLASARQTVEQHGGEISVVSEPGVGSSFIVRLPLGMSIASSSVSAANALEMPS